MATKDELRELSKKRIKTARSLICCDDWEMSAYMMAMALELALKAASCKSLRLQSYPDATSDNKYFKTHNFDRLLLVSGMTDIFSVSIPMFDQNAFENWSIFTKAFLFNGKDDRDYVAMRYDSRMQAIFNEQKAKELFSSLYNDEHSIIKTMIRYRRW
jgi:hypothetical protein